MIEEKIREESADYGTWFSLRLVFFCLAPTQILILISLMLPLPGISFLFWTLSGVSSAFSLYAAYMYYILNRNDKEFQNHLRNLVPEKLTWDGKGKVLDIGTGRGPIAIKIAKKFPKAKISGIDLWGKSWKYSKEICEKNATIEGVIDQIDLRKANAAKLPYNNGEFDAVVSNMVFHEVRDVKDKREVIKEALRVLKKGGAFSFQDLFLVKGYYGEIDDLLDAIRGCGVEELNFEKTENLMNIPRLMLFERRAGVISGYK